jgi:hypothetical protein
MLKDKTVRKTLGGTTAEWCENFNSRVSTWIFPACGEGDFSRTISYPTADGLILYLIKRIEKLEEKVGQLKVKQK